MISSLVMMGAAGVSGIFAASAGFALFGGGALSNLTTSKYIYSDDATTAGTNLNVERYNHAAAGNSVIGIFAGGQSAGTGATTNKYIYSDNANVVGTNLNVGRYNHAATSSVPGGF
jgi:hypothetical protein